MNCKLKLTPYKAMDGRPVCACVRPGCDVVAFNTPENTISPHCKAPTFAVGNFAAGVIEALTLGIVKEKPGCGCDARRKRWNRKYSFPLPGFVYRYLVRHGLLTKPEESRLERLVALRRIR